ncbi:tRNA 2'-phosphotransferase 1 isoform X1 [Synchiropus splendidus]|uniref:tRNA 2'-phosphotransferase 1 isoform X1 n=1 Tax=Synchiropus splendidus TaxID=270530 RepID=UPI00237DE07A|nr:tRNA 2'-phosphotransferase 1 isoform X1 [Synchiropus splendidus]
MDRGEGGRRSKGKRGRREEDRYVRLSKSLSYVLRHGASQMGLHLSTDGFLYVDDLLAHPQFHSYSLEDVQRVVDTNDKQRFKLRPHTQDGRLQIRANQGHTVQVKDLELKPVQAGSPDCPAEAVHGSYMRHWTSIQQQGLGRMRRTHIHLAPGLPGEDGVISGELVCLVKHFLSPVGTSFCFPPGMRRDCNLAVFIDVPKALNDGIEFFWSENQVLLTPGDSDGMLLPKYFSRALQLRPTRTILPLQS